MKRYGIREVVLNWYRSHLKKNALNIDKQKPSCIDYLWSTSRVSIRTKFVHYLWITEIPFVVRRIHSNTFGGDNRNYAHKIKQIKLNLYKAKFKLLGNCKINTSTSDDRLFQPRKSKRKHIHHSLGVIQNLMENS